MLVHLRKGERYAEVAAGFGVGVATAWRCVTETVALLARRATKLDQAIRAAKKVGYPHLVLDGTLIRIGRVAADRPYYSGKNWCQGMNIQVLAAPDGTIVWTSGSLPGSVHDLTAARIWGIIRRLKAAGPATLADKGYVGAGEPVRVPYKGRGKPGQKIANSAHAKLHGPGERANAQLKNWRILQKLRLLPKRAGQLVKPIHVLQTREAGRKGLRPYGRFRSRNRYGQGMSTPAMLHGARPFPQSRNMNLYP